MSQIVTKVAPNSTVVLYSWPEVLEGRDSIQVQSNAPLEVYEGPDTDNVITLDKGRLCIAGEMTREKM